MQLHFQINLYKYARLYRQGQKNTVVIHHLVTADTIDENILKSLERKDAVQTALMDAVKARIGVMADESRGNV